VREKEKRRKLEDGKTYPSFALQLSGEYLPSKDLYEKPLRINFGYNFPIYSYSDVLSGKIKAETFKDKIVLIGATAPDLHDDQIVPTSNGLRLSGIEIHANAIQTILDGNFLNSESNLATVLTIFAVTITTLVILTLLKVRFGILVTVVLFVAYFSYVFFSFDHGIIRNVIYPPLGIILCFIGSLILKYLTETNQKRFLRRAFSHYVSKEVVNEIVNNPKKLVLGGEKKLVTVLFTDIQGFTSISEKADPETLTNQLNDYLSQMTEIILENKGVVDKFIGDSVMAFWGAPLENKDHAILSCKAALLMQDVTVGEFKTRIGINTGEAIVGNMGSKDRFDYTALGDTVNIASRLEGLNKEYKSQILISESTYKLVKDQVIVNKIGKATVRGKTKAINVYELVDIKSFE
ncbi:adenylate/guanylate cyclase domain-containing protein, partial [Candidatus Microgenomates bacterium]|nr:adenylate/guanylate cyclase domain-containing protein [Candidatus Microgenomates bacterium]